MRLNWKILRLAALALLLATVAGCGGLTASKSISPASFFLPGFLQADPPPAHPESTTPADEPGTMVAQS
ncbi:MAG TPA: hypothetical protein VG146_18120 [Verrucomicrobiae bacterium]|nr:hypothetical protein [Verrucomicrobiae bacterium]